MAELALRGSFPFLAGHTETGRRLPAARGRGGSAKKATRPPRSCGSRSPNHARQPRRQETVIRLLDRKLGGQLGRDIAPELPAISGGALASQPDSERSAELERRVVELEDQLLEREGRSTVSGRRRAKRSARESSSEQLAGPSRRGRVPRSSWRFRGAPRATLRGSPNGAGGSSGRVRNRLRPRRAIPVEADLHYPNEFCILIGPSAKGRKGSSWGTSVV